MLREAEAVGLIYDVVRKETVLGERGGGYVKPNPKADAHESLKGWWLPAEAVWKKHYDRQTKVTSRRINLGRRRTWPSKPSVHRSACDRGEEYAKCLPQDAIICD
jgi:hypothetical protein